MEESQDLDAGARRPALARQRQTMILGRVREEGAVRVADLVRELGVSDMTIRRDLEVLHERGLIEKVHGGAAAIEGSSLFEPGFKVKSTLMQHEKDAIGSGQRREEPGGALRISDSPENRSALIVNSADVTDPATGQFGLTIPIDSVETLNVYQTPYLSEYGRFTAGLVSVETRRGGDKWKWELNDPFPDFRIRSYHMRGVKDATPRLNFEGPIIPHRLFLSEGAMTPMTYVGIDGVPRRPAWASASVRLHDGRIMVVGGAASQSSFDAVATAAIFDPAIGRRPGVRLVSVDEAAADDATVRDHVAAVTGETNLANNVATYEVMFTF